MARDEARRLLGKVVEGGDPAGDKQEARKAETMAALCDAYLDAALAGKILRRGKPKKASTLAIDRGHVGRHIKPQLGHIKVAAVTTRDLERFYDDVSEGKTAACAKTGKHGLARVTGGRAAAARTLALLGVAFSYAVRQGLRTDNPAHGIEKHACNERQRRASDAKYAALGEALRTMPETAWPLGVAATKFLSLTGWRSGEALALRWSEVDLVTRTARLADTKTGFSLRPLSHEACEVLRGLPRPRWRGFPRLDRE